ncbi:uncharacterized protein LOC131946154 [Physella acuta]|uniref:uncharacterized protein LOC131946154 n=1 Tax=Physella acuta TaxID=109671 RepID=UPI0027DD383A|nr:uncharacterized protein LOC131946154 [Physella acuta]XP_059162789.1 uncharacterized protein LOC131946154 [Physella acuta]
MPLNEADCAVTYKILVIGDHDVGKTSLLTSLTGREFSETNRPTVGVDFVRKIFEVDGALVQLQIWDTSGLEKFRSITKSQYKDVHGFFLVYDVTSLLSFEALAYWMSSLDPCDRHGKYEPTPVVLCGNKTDLVSQKKVSTSQAQQFANKEMAFGFFETSARSGENVFAAFQYLAYHVTDICDPKLMKSYHPFLIRRKSKYINSLHKPPALRDFYVKKKKSKQKQNNNVYNQDVSLTLSEEQSTDTQQSQHMNSINCQPFKLDNSAELSEIGNSSSERTKKCKSSSRSSSWCCFGRRKKVK